MNKRKREIKQIATWVIATRELVFVDSIANTVSTCHDFLAHVDVGKRQIMHLVLEGWLVVWSVRRSARLLGPFVVGQRECQKAWLVSQLTSWWVVWLIGWMVIWSIGPSVGRCISLPARILLSQLVDWSMFLGGTPMGHKILQNGDKFPIYACPPVHSGQRQTESNS